MRQRKRAAIFLNLTLITARPAGWLSRVQSVKEFGRSRSTNDGMSDRALCLSRRDAWVGFTNKNSLKTLSGGHGGKQLR